MPAFIALLSGLLFGTGLIVCGMANPAKVLAFLDVTGRWDPSLMLVMGTAVLVAAPAFALARRRDRSALGLPMRLPALRQIDRRVVLGSVVFGVGWGIAGLCPGPALVTLGTGEFKAVLFVAAMLIGRAIYETLEHLRLAR
jgi:uncharacterized membrane protein YedE/YeeE